MVFKKKLPKLEVPNGIYFITFSTWERLELNPMACQLVLDGALFFDNQRYKMFAMVIMPDHVHLLIQPFVKSKSGAKLQYWSIGSILHNIKGYSSHKLPEVMTHIGKVWQDGCHDVLIRNQDHFMTVWEYIRNNPVKAGLSSVPEDYPYFWESDVLK